jgi:hypothetical protein
MNFGSLDLIDNHQQLDIEKDKVIVEKSGKAYQIGIEALIDRIDTKARAITKTSWVFLGRDDVKDILNEEIEVRANQTTSRTLKVADFDDIAVPAFCRRLLFVFDIDNLDVFTKYRGFYRIISPAIGSRKKILVILENVQDAMDDATRNIVTDKMLQTHLEVSRGNSRTISKQEKLLGPLSAANKIPSASFPNRNMEPANQIKIDIRSGASRGYLHSMKILAWSY